MEEHHQEILQTILEMDSIRANPRYKALILMSRQSNEKREYESYCNKIRLLQNRVDKIKESFPNNYGKTYDQFLLEKNTPQFSITMPAVSSVLPIPSAPPAPPVTETESTEEEDFFTKLYPDQENEDEFSD